MSCTASADTNVKYTKDAALEKLLSTYPLRGSKCMKAHCSGSTANKYLPNPLPYAVSNTTRPLCEPSHLSSAESPFSKIVPDLVNIVFRSSSMDDPLWLN